MRRRSTRRRCHLVTLATMLTLVALGGGCTSDEPSSSSPTPQQHSPTPTTERETTSSANATVKPVPVAQWRRMTEAGMIRPECPIQRRAQLRRVEVNHLGFGGRTRRGHLVVNRDVARSVARIFTQLYDAEFPIRRMQSLEAYGGDNAASLRADNTAAFNCRRSDETNAPFQESPHANGRAIDINPRENPWMDLRCDCWSPGARFADRTRGRGKILRGGVVWRSFRAEGWIWQNIDVADYMHFDTGYPSRPFDLKTQPRGGGTR